MPKNLNNFCSYLSSLSLILINRQANNQLIMKQHFLINFQSMAYSPFGSRVERLTLSESPSWKGLLPLFNFRFLIHSKTFFRCLFSLCQMISCGHAEHHILFKYENNVVALTNSIHWNVIEVSVYLRIKRRSVYTRLNQAWYNFVLNKKKIYWKSNLWSNQIDLVERISIFQI